MGKKLSIVVPCYNEEAALPVFYAAILPVMGKLQACGEIGDFELIFVDDGSRDSTLNQLKLLAQKDCHVKYFSFSRNFGKEAALLCGLRESSGDYVVTMDVDLQDPPGLIPEMLRVVTQEGFDCAGTRRVTRKGEPPVRSFFARQFYRIMRSLTDIEVVDGARDFRLMSRPMVNAIISMPERIRFSKGIFPWVGFKTRWFEYENIERSAGSTKWSFWSLFLYSIDGITAFSSKPLVLASSLGILSLFLAFCLVIFIIIRKLVFGDPTAGWPSLVCIILTVGGLQLFCTGVLGQYLAKIYTEVKARPSYIIKEQNS
ncbi:MAG: glycosyltransferase family 2 protein [Treponema sp.]|nr:glycosyltransferase family 2 protein [Spirochaetia bacterium]MDD7275242.1 glycosyltransferase family 2 protein [Treponema sp.]